MSDILIRGGRVFSGHDRPSRMADVLVQQGRVTAISERAIEVGPDTKVVEAAGKWVVPGFIDNHTHYDGEVLVAPSLSESVRHGVTTVMLGSCSLSFIYSNVEDCCDMFTRVEAFPRDVLLPILHDQKRWNDTRGWLDHMHTLPVGPNYVSFLGHSDIRARAMGIDRSLDPKQSATPAEIQQMVGYLEESMDAGFIGISMQHNPWDKMDGRHWSKLLPAAYANRRERGALTAVARRRDGHLQGVPNLVSRVAALWYMTQSSAFFWRKRLRTSMVAMMDLKGDPYILSLLSAIATFFNKVLRADFRMQALPVPFTVYAKGMDLVIFEEFPTGQLARHLARDRQQRDATLKDPKYRQQFKRHYANRLAPKIWQKDFGDAFVTDAPDKSWIGKSFLEIARQRNQHPVDAFLDIVVDMDSQIEWKTTIGNHDPLRYKKLYTNPNAIFGFADSGAHIDNLALYNFPLRSIKYLKDAHERGDPFMSYEKLIWRLTKENADFFHIDAGVIQEGSRADIVVIDFDRLDDSVHEYHYADFLGGTQRLVNRNDEVVKLVMIGGRIAWEDGAFAQQFGSQRYGCFLKGKHLY
ncbi:MAG: amidohydrolase family protein [Pirellulaceae bacterium]|nr:amidohydrolase family protein [Pirellulaceae bacterium]